MVSGKSQFILKLIQKVGKGSGIIRRILPHLTVCLLFVFPLFALGADSTGVGTKTNSDGDLKQGQAVMEVTLIDGSIIRRTIHHETITVEDVHHVAAQTERPVLRYVIKRPNSDWVPMEGMFYNGGMLYFTTRNVNGKYVFNRLLSSMGSGTVDTFNKEQCKEEIKKMAMRSADLVIVRGLYDNPYDWNGELGWFWHGLEGRSRKAILGGGYEVAPKELGLTSEDINRYLILANVHVYLKEWKLPEATEAYRQAIGRLVEEHFDEIYDYLQNKGGVFLGVADNASMTTLIVLKAFRLIVAFGFVTLIIILLSKHLCKRGTSNEKSQA
jgi:hypothetical protein